MKERNPSDSPIIKLKPPITDDRGEIVPLVEKESRSTLIIRSKKNTIRANHYHKTDWHYCYLLSGKMNYYSRAVDSKDKPSCVTVEAGQMIYTPPMLEHAMEFLEDTSFLTVSGNPRNQEAYEKDLVRVQLIRPK